jgi:hypothetical protein
MKSKKKAASRKSTRGSQKAADDNGPMSFAAGQENLVSNGRRNERPRHKNTETAEEKKQRLAKREALTLRAFQIAYDNHHPRRSS